MKMTRVSSTVDAHSSCLYLLEIYLVIHTTTSISEFLIEDASDVIFTRDRSSIHFLRDI